MCQTTVGWKFLVEWANGSRQWIELKILKESNPVKVAEYTMACDIGEEPAFAWWVPYLLRKRDGFSRELTSSKNKPQIWH